MADELKNYLQSHGAEPVDAGWLEALLKDMTKNVVPDIVAQVQEREQSAAELRYTPVRRRAASED